MRLKYKLYGHEFEVDSGEEHAFFTPWILDTMTSDKYRLSLMFNLGAGSHIRVPYLGGNARGLRSICKVMVLMFGYDGGGKMHVNG